MKVKDLLDSSEKWTQDAFSRNIFNEPQSSVHLDSVKWCLTGAMIKCYDPCTDIYKKAYVFLGGSVMKWNDAPGRKFEDIRKLIEELDI